MPERHRVLRVLVVDPSIEDVKRVRDLLHIGGEFVTQVARSAEEARRFLADGAFDVALIDYGVWGEGGSELVRAVREEHGDLAVVLLTSGDNEREALPALKLGAHDFLNKQHIAESGQLATRLLAAYEESRALRRRDTMVRWLEREARTDHLTGLYNRRAFDDRLRELCDSNRGSGAPVTLIVADVAGTRMVNEAHGHEVGDDMIRRAGAGIMRCIRGSDFAARVGGDDFGVILPDADLDLGRLVARRIAHQVESLNAGEWSALVPVELSFGVATGRDCNGGELFTAADQQLSRYKVYTPALPMIRERDDGDGPHVA